MTELDITRVNVMMGNQCNFHCRHCIQTGSVAPQQKASAAEAVLSYIRHLAAIRPPAAPKVAVYFWGGEPLLYMPVIRQVVHALHDTVTYVIVTNGELISKEIVDFLNAHQISLVLSNDGIQTAHVRGRNVLDSTRHVGLFKQVRRFSVDACITAYNQDYYALWAYLEDIFGKDVSICHEPLEVTWGMPEDLYDFDREAYRLCMHRIADRAYAQLCKGEISREYALISSMVRRILQIADGKPIDPIRCSQMRHMVNIDLDGNLYACHNGCTTLGTVADSFDDVHAAYARHMETLLKGSECRHCPYLSLCGYGCPNAPASAGKSACCDMKKIFIAGCLRFVQHLQQTLDTVDLEDSYDCD